MTMEQWKQWGEYAKSDWVYHDMMRIPERYRTLIAIAITAGRVYNIMHGSGSPGLCGFCISAPSAASCRGCIVIKRWGFPCSRLENVCRFDEGRTPEEIRRRYGPPTYKMLMDFYREEYEKVVTE